MHIQQKLLITFIIAAGLSACSSDTPLPPVIEMPTPIAESPASPCEEVACEDNNKMTVEQIYDHIINGGQVGLVDNLFAQDFTQRNQNIAAGIEGLTAFYNSLLVDNPSHVANIKHIVADGDYVAVHWHYSNSPDDEFSGTAHVDLYQLLDDQIIEHQSYAMNPSSATASGNSVFSDLYDYGDALPNNDVAVEEDNKVHVTEFYVDAFNNKNLTRIETSVDANYIQHNHFVPNGRAALINFVANNAVDNVSVFLSLAEDDIVWTFRDDAPIVDLWRIDNNTGLIVEHWDVF
jgi:predicted SnoaL-like aldol condensation-catalyzing enzyme